MNLARSFMSVVLVGSFGFASADLLVDRGLPVENLNASTSARSNVSWADYWIAGSGYSYMLGDTFSVAGTGTYNLDTIRVWVVGDEFATGSDNKLSLWGGTAGVSMLSDVYTMTAVNYADGTKYLGSSGVNSYTVWQVDFDVDWNVQAGETQSFYLGGQVINVDGLVYPDYEGYAFTPYMHASNAALSGSSQDGSNGWVLEAELLNGKLSNIYTLKSGQDKGDMPWDKTSDFNVQVFGQQAVPGPAAAIPFALGLLAAAKRRRK